MLRATLLALTTASALAATSLSAGPGAAPRVLAATPTAAPAQARAVAREQVDDAVAAAIVGSITSQFDADDVVVQLGAVKVRPASIQDRRVEGSGRVRVEGGDWIPFRFATQYDTQNREVTYPQLELGGGTGTPLAQGDAVAKSLDRAVERALSAEFPEQRVRWTLAQARQAEAGRYVHVDGTGTADFGADGDTPAHVDGLYDRVANRWVRVHYELGPGSEWDAPSTGIAAL